MLDAGVPPDALAFYGRWWQLESWLREVVYVELRAKYGPAWTEHLSGRAPTRAERDQRNEYMASADAGELLAYADVSDLFDLIEDHWNLFEPLLPPRLRWQGTADELRDMRNRNAHCRRPHRDDLARLEQTLRNLEPGARRFYTSYTNDQWLSRDSHDRLARAWVDGKHDTARRLLQHAARQYDVHFRLGYSVRPWADAPDPDRVSGTAGVLWKPSWILGGPHTVRPADLWRRLRDRHANLLLIHVVVDLSQVTAAMSALNEPDDVADEIGRLFDDVLMRGRTVSIENADDIGEDYFRNWRRGVEELPRWMQADTSPLALVDPYNPDAFRFFSAD
jgi:hypothetical protein